MVAAGIVWIGLTPRSAGEVAVFAAPWQPAAAAMAIVARADGRLVRTGFADWVVVAASDDAAFIQRLYAAGAWIVADPAAAGACVVLNRGEA